MKITVEELNKFDTLTDAYNQLIKCQITLKQASDKTKHDFRTLDDIENGYYFLNPIDIDYQLKQMVENVKLNIVDLVFRYMDKKFNNLVIDIQDVIDFIEGGEVIQKMGIDKPIRPVMKGPFTARAVIDYIEDKYADEETITLQQIKENARHALPRVSIHTTDKASKLEHIPVIGNTGIELISRSYYASNKEDSTAAVIKLIHIKLNHILPSQAEHHNIDYSDKYSDDVIKSLRRYKNGKLKLIFHKQGDMEIIRRLLVGCDE